MDSLFIEIPDNSPNIYGKIRKMNKVLIDVNDLIKSYTKNDLMPRCGYESKYCETNFKGELLIDLILFIDKKKSYAYKQIAQEADVDDNNNLISGKILDPPKIVKRSTLGLKGDTIPLTKKIMQDIIDISFEPKTTIQQKYHILLQKYKQWYQDLKEAIDNLDIKLIASPVKWQKQVHIVNAMKFYNQFFEQVFEPLVPGLATTCKFLSLQSIKKLDPCIDVTKMKHFVFPTNFNKEFVKEKMDKLGIYIDIEEQWKKINNTVCESLISNIKDNR